MRSRKLAIKLPLKIDGSNDLGPTRHWKILHYKNRTPDLHHGRHGRADSSVAPSYAQRPDVGDQPGLIADDSVELHPQFKRTAVFYRTNEAPGTIIVHTTDRFLYLVQGDDRALRYGIGVGRDGFPGGLEDLAQDRMAGLDAAAGDDPAPALSAALHGRRPRQSDGRTRAVSRLDGLSHPRHQSAGDDRHAVSSGCFRLVNGEVTTFIRAFRSAPRSCGRSRNCKPQRLVPRPSHFPDIGEKKCFAHSEAAS